MDTSTSQPGLAWQPDYLGGGLEYTNIYQPDDYSGAVKAVLVRLHAKQGTPRAILYVHGYSDYFFNRELAETFSRNGYNFYALDLRKYGRSYLPGQRMFQVRDLHEYFADIDAAIDIILRDGNPEIALLGHSTGGLTVSLYMSERHNHAVRGVMLNSPFLAWNLSIIEKKIAIPFLSMIGRWKPDVRLKLRPDRGYAESISSAFDGEWDYDSEYKPDILPDPDLGWIRAIYEAQCELRKSRLDVPVLLMRSSDSVRKGDRREKYSRADAILDVESISRRGLELSDRVTEIIYPGALHDIALSRKEIRVKMAADMLAWLNEVMIEK